MKEVLLAGTVLNYYGAMKIFLTAVSGLQNPHSGPEEYLQFKFFTAGAAGVFGSLYLYLYFNTVYVVPFLIFGAALKSWAFLLSLGLHYQHRLSRQAFMEFGLSNGLVAVLFWIYISQSSAMSNI